MVSLEIDQMLVRGGSNIHKRYRSRVKGVVGDTGQMLDRDGSNISQR